MEKTNSSENGSEMSKKMSLGSLASEISGILLLTTFTVQSIAVDKVDGSVTNVDVRIHAETSGIVALRQQLG